MNCPDARQWFSAWADSALTAAERSELERHLGECPECRRELERFEGTVALVRRAERPRAPAGFVDRVMELARPAPWYRRWARRLFVPLWVKLPAEAAAALVVAALVSYAVQRTPELGQAVREDMYSAPASSRAPAAPSTAEVRQRSESATPRSQALSAIRKEAPEVSPPAESTSRAPAQPSTPAPSAQPAPATSSSDAPSRGDSGNAIGAARQVMAKSRAGGSRLARAKTTRDAQDAAPGSATDTGALTKPATPGAESQHIASAQAPPGPAQATSVSPQAAGANPSGAIPRTEVSNTGAAPQTAGADQRAAGANPGSAQQAAGASPSGAVAPPTGASPAAPPKQSGEARPGVAAKPDAGGSGVALQPAREPAPIPRPRPAVEERADPARESKALLTAPKSTASRVLSAPDVAGRLTVKDGEAAERALASALAQAGGAVLARRHEAGATVVDVVVPRGGYAGFGRSLAAIGNWAPDAEPPELPDQVRVTLRLVQ